MTTNDDLLDQAIGLVRENREKVAEITDALLALQMANLALTQHLLEAGKELVRLRGIVEAAEKATGEKETTHGNQRDHGV